MLVKKSAWERRGIWCSNLWRPDDKIRDILFAKFNDLEQFKILLQQSTKNNVF